MRPNVMATLALVIFAGHARAGADSVIPAEAPNDAIMASSGEIAAAADWALAAFAGRSPEEAKTGIRLEVRRQDHSVLKFGQSCIDTPLQIGKQRFDRGLGTHANSVIAVTIPPTARRFEAAVGVDNNPNTGGVGGSVQFAVEIAGREVFRTPTLKGGADPVAVHVPIPADTREILLKVDATEDGVAHDHGDWADARIILEDGTALRLDLPGQTFMEARLPFSFLYDGKPSAHLLKGWKQTTQTQDAADRVRHHVAWTDPATGLKVSAMVSVFKRCPAVEWVLHFENTGAQDSPLIEKIQAIDAVLRTGYTRTPAVLHQILGDSCSERSYLPTETSLEPDKPVNMAPTGGRSSNGTFPFFNVQYGDEGMVTAIGWTGQWSANLSRANTGPTRLQAGMELTHLRLHPGEKIRSPRILVMPWKGDRIAAHQRFRRLLMFHYAPRPGGRPVQMPFAAQCFDRYYNARPRWGSEAEQITVARAAARHGCDTHWLDAAWFDKGFPHGVGNWDPRPEGFPSGMGPLADEVHRLGMRFMVWFEPERVAAGSNIAREHPEFVIGGAGGGLFNLGDPKARRFMTDLLSKRITDFKLDIYRNDFNMDPLDFWRRSDAPDRQGMTEIRYVEGLYEMWDELLVKHPGLWIDNCSGGGRRIDLEMCSRAVPLWRSDTGCSPGHADWHQNQAYGLSFYIPLFGGCAWTPDAYEVRSTATAGAIFQFDFLNENLPLAQTKAAMDEARANSPFWSGDFYPLTRAAPALDQMLAYQFHRSDLDAGLVLAFRRPESNYRALGVNLRGLTPDSTYAVEVIDDARQVTRRNVTGAELSSEFELRIPTRPGSLVVRYRKAS